MDSIARIGSSIQIKGEVTSREPLVIAGKVEGTVDVEGHALTLDPGGRLDANIIAQTIVIAGVVKGSLTAEDPHRRERHGVHRGRALGARDQPGGRGDGQREDRHGRSQEARVVARVLSVLPGAQRRECGGYFTLKG